MKIRCLLTAMIALALTGLPACKSHKATVVRAGAPAVTAKKSSNKSNAKSVPNMPSLDSRESDVDSKVAGNLVKEARRWIGTPYRYGGNDRKGIDCSGFVMSVFMDAAGVALPRTSATQAEYCREIPKKKLQPGDLVFFSTSTRGGKVSHVGLYIGNDKMIHASASRGVIESGLNENYYVTHYHSSGRVQAITVASTGGKKSKKGDALDVRMADEGIVPAETQESESKSGATAKAATAPAVAPTKQKKDKSPAKKKNDKKSVESKSDKNPVATITLEQFEQESAKHTVRDSARVASDSVVVRKKVVEEKPVEKRDTVATDTVRQADAIRNEVTKAMKFGR